MSYRSFESIVIIVPKNVENSGYIGLREMKMP